MIGVGAVDVICNRIRKRTLLLTAHQLGGSRKTWRGHFILFLTRHISWSSREKGGEKAELGRLCSNKGNVGDIPFRTSSASLKSPVSSTHLLDLALGLDHSAKDDEVNEC